VTHSDYRLLEQTELFQVDPHPVQSAVLDHWYEREHALRNEWVRLRAQMFGRDPKPDLRDIPPDPEAAQIARELVPMPPRQAEARLLTVRWRWLEELEAAHYFDVERLIIYLLKLRLMEREAEFDKQRSRRLIDHYQTQVGRLTREALEEIVT
jgi:hypothetical protein